MAEARAAVAELNIPANLDEGKKSWKEIYNALRKWSKRNYYKTRNSISNGTYPTSVSNLVAVVAICFGLMFYQPEPTRGLNLRLCSLATGFPLPDGAPLWFKYALTSVCVGIAFFLVLAKVRQYLLRMLLTYRGWLYENLKTQSARTVVWALCVRMISGYQPSLYSCQRSLPRLHVPNLHSTLKNLLESLKPLTTAEELETLRNDAIAFEKGTGSKLQKILQLKSWWVPNYVSDWWEKYVYLMARSPLPINSNYYGMDQSYWAPTNDQKVRAATTIYHLLQFKRLIDREELQPMVLRNTIPICMAQYDRIFSTTRIPRRNLDKLRHFDSTLSRHIIVQYKGIYYSMDAYDSKNQIICPAVFHSQIEWMIKDAHEAIANGKISDAARKLPALTGLPRDEWADIRKEFLTVGKNKDLLNILESGIFIAILSDASPQTLSEKGKELLHSDGKTMWFDKSLNVTFFKNGGCGLNAEHSMADAPAIAHSWEYAMTKEIIEKWYTDDGHCMPLAKSFRQGKYKLPVRLTWEMSPALETHIVNACELMEKNCGDLDLVIVDHGKWGKGVIKNFNVSPDAFVQIAIQLAYFRATGRFAQTYEASMTRLYLSGRTETVRSCTEESSDFVRAMDEDDQSTENKIRLFRTAAEKHQQLYRDSMNGKGIDRHLFALYIVCKGFGYTSEFLEKIVMRPWTLSTSQQPQQQLMNVPDSNLPLFQDKVSPGGGFGPVSDSGYGVSYMLPSDHKFFFHVTSKHSCPETSSQQFVNRIFQGLEDLKVLFESGQSYTQNGHPGEGRLRK